MLCTWRHSSKLDSVVCCYFVVTLAMLLHLINCRFIIIYCYSHTWVTTLVEYDWHADHHLRLNLTIVPRFSSHLDILQSIRSHQLPMQVFSVLICFLPFTSLCRWYSVLLVSGWLLINIRAKVFGPHWVCGMMIFFAQYMCISATFIWTCWSTHCYHLPSLFHSELKTYLFRKSYPPP